MSALATHRLSILIVDDEPDWLRKCETFAGTQECDVTFAGNGHEAVTYLETHFCDLVITNVLLRRALSDGWLGEFMAIVGIVLTKNIDTLVITANAQNPQIADWLQRVSKFGGRIHSVVDKRGDPGTIAAAIQSLIAKLAGHSTRLESAVAELVLPQTTEERLRMYQTALAAMDGFFEAEQYTFTIDSVTRSFLEEMRVWFERCAGQDRAGRILVAWSAFQKDPRKNKESLMNSLIGLAQPEEPSLNMLIKGLMSEIEQRKSASLYAVMTSRRYTLEQLENTCRNMDIDFGQLGSRRGQNEVAEYLRDMANTRPRIRRELIFWILQTNPTPLLTLSI